MDQISYIWIPAFLYISNTKSLMKPLKFYRYCWGFIYHVARPNSSFSISLVAAV